MFRKFLVLLMLAVVFASAAGSADKSSAVGVWAQGGNPGEKFGMDYEMRLDPMTTLDFYLHFNFTKHDNALGLYVGYYWHYFDIINLPAEAGRMGLYWGPAGGVGWWGYYDEDGFALRAGIVGGWEWEFPHNIPLELYVELNPVGEFHIVTWDNDSDTDWKLPDVYIRLGLRFWF